MSRLLCHDVDVVDVGIDFAGHRRPSHLRGGSNRPCSDWNPRRIARERSLAAPNRLFARQYRNFGTLIDKITSGIRDPGQDVTMSTPRSSLFEMPGGHTGIHKRSAMTRMGSGSGTALSGDRPLHLSRKRQSDNMDYHANMIKKDCFHCFPEFPGWQPQLRKFPSSTERTPAPGPRRGASRSACTWSPRRSGGRRLYLRTPPVWG